MSRKSGCFGGASGVLWLKRNGRKSSAAPGSSLEPVLAVDKDRLSDEDTQPTSVIDNPGDVQELKDPAFQSPLSIAVDSDTRDKPQSSLSSNTFAHSPEPFFSPSPFSEETFATKTGSSGKNFRLQSWSRQTLTKKRKQFGGRKRWVSIEPDHDTQSKHARLLHENGSNVNSDTVKSEGGSVIDEECERSVVDNVTWDQLMDPTIAVVSQSSQTSETSTLDISTDPESILDTSTDSTIDEPIQQPGSATSLSLAQRFFEQLDVQHPLKIEATNGNTPRRRVKACGRSRRVMTFQDPRIHQEYDAYTAMCREADVDPLPLRAFLTECSTMRNSVYEGFFDE